MKFLRLLVILVCCIAFGTAVAYFAIPEKRNVIVPTTSAVQTSAVKVSKTVDLSGKWESQKSTVGSKAVVEIRNNTVLVQFYMNDGYTTIWYGTFDVLQPGQKTMVSKAIKDDGHFALSQDDTKEFLYQNDGLIFSFKIMGTRTTMELKRV